jgi:3-hydroxyisobutyrate dehydrogenase
VIGLGSMGYGAAQSLLRAGFAVHGVDVRPEVLERFAKEGGKPFTSAAEGAKGADAVITFVVNAEQTENVLLGADGAAATMKRDGVVIACATVPPLFTEALGKKLASAGLELLDAPVSGGASRAASGEMTVMASGSAQAFARSETVLKAIAIKVHRLGDTVGIGSRVKVIHQLLAGVHIAAASECMALGIKAGIDPRALYEVITGAAGNSWMFENRVPHILDGDYTPRSAVDIFVKDLGIVLETGKALSISLPVAATAHELFKAASGMGLGREDDSAVVKVYAKQAGIELPKRA